MIEADIAFAAVGTVAVVTNGWSDEAVEATAAELAASCTDPDALLVAARHLAHTWTPRHRPPLAVFLDEYRSEVRRRQLQRVELPAASSSIVDPAHGRRIAARAYADACAEAGREPDWDRQHQFAKAIGADQQ